jgi:hypothetical protein
MERIAMVGVGVAEVAVVKVPVVEIVVRQVVAIDDRAAMRDIRIVIVDD